LNPRLAPGVDEVLRRALARDPSERYPSIEEFRRALAAPLGPAAHRRRRLPLIACVLVLLCVSLVFFFRARNHTDASSVKLQSWLVLDGTESWEGDAEHDAGLPVQARVVTRGPAPQDAKEPELPAWPAPRPVLVISSPG